MYKDKKQLTAKIVIIGDISVGKSSITIRYVYDKFDLKQESTLGAAYMQKITTFTDPDAQFQTNTRKNSKDQSSGSQGGRNTNRNNQKHIKLQIWDTAGQQKYKAIAKLYYRDCRIAILVYDITRRQTFQNLRKWHQQLLRHAPKNIFLVVVANKIDLLDTLINQTYVTHLQGQMYATSINAKYYESSAKNKKGIQEMFNMIADHIGPIIYKEKKDNSNQVLTSSIIESSQKKKKKCCS